MRIGILADIHANKYALDAVRKDADGQRVDRFWFLGDAIGYGPHPLAALEFLLEVGARSWVPGNHEALLVGELLLAAATEDARRSLALNKKWLDQEQILKLSAVLGDRFRGLRGRKKLTHVKRCGAHRYVLCHGALRRGPFIPYVYPWNRTVLSDEFEDLAKLNVGTRRVCLLLGHTHVPFLCYARQGGDGQFQTECPRMPYGEEMFLGEGLAIANPGSVGQPRDGDPRAAYAILDTKAHTILFRRVEYPVARTQRDLAARGHADLNNLVRRLRRATRPDEWPQNWAPCVSDDYHTSTGKGGQPWS